MTIDKSQGDATSWALQFFNDVIDSMNAPRQWTNEDPHLRRPITPSSGHDEFWIQALRYLREIQFIDVTTGQPKRATTPCLQNLRTTLEGFRTLRKTLLGMGFEEIYPRYLSTDVAENFFAQIKGHGGDSRKPTCKHYEESHKALLINRLTSPTGIGSNCEFDRDNQLLVSVKSLFKQRPVEVTYNCIYVIILL